MDGASSSVPTSVGQTDPPRHRGDHIRARQTACPGQADVEVVVGVGGRYRTWTSRMQAP